MAKKKSNSLTNFSEPSSAGSSGKKAAAKNAGKPSSAVHHVTMYHGTTMHGADCIRRDGFEASLHGLLGKGVYLTTDKSKAGLYGPKLLTCSVDVGRECCIDRPDHPDRKTWPRSCDTKWIPAHAVHRWIPALQCNPAHAGDVYCVRDMTRIAIINVHDERCCPCSIAECRQCFADRKQQRAHAKQQSTDYEGGKGKGRLSFIPTPTSHSEACCSQAPPKDDSDSSVCVSDGKVDCRDQCLALVSGSEDDSRVDAVDPWELHWQACQIAEKVAAAPVVGEYSNTPGALQLVSECDGTNAFCSTPLITVRNTFLDFRGQSASFCRAFSAPSATRVAVHDRCSNGLALEDADGKIDGSTTTAGSGTSDDDVIQMTSFIAECRTPQRRSKRW